ncbi:unnamed protein product [Gadus morhua 'NCC']
MPVLTGTISTVQVPLVGHNLICERRSCRRRGESAGDTQCRPVCRHASAGRAHSHPGPAPPSAWPVSSLPPPYGSVIKPERRGEQSSRGGSRQSAV